MQSWDLSRRDGGPKMDLIGFISAKPWIVVEKLEGGNNTVRFLYRYLAKYLGENLNKI
jgi:hypothetical protein